MVSGGTGNVRAKARTHMVTVATMTLRNIGMVRNRLAMATNCNLNVFHADGLCKWGNFSATVLFSKVD